MLAPGDITCSAIELLEIAEVLARTYDTVLARDDAIAAVDVHLNTTLCPALSAASTMQGELERELIIKKKKTLLALSGT